MSVLEEFFNLDFTGPEIRVGVVGDAMVDEYFNVKVKKISPEFPIPVMHTDTDESENYPGGAANVSYQFKHFNVTANLIAFTDCSANVCFNQRGVNTALCLNIDLFGWELPSSSWVSDESTAELMTDFYKRLAEDAAAGSCYFRRIPRKRRFYSNDFPTYRWDVEQTNYGLMDELDNKCFELYQKAQEVAKEFDVMIFSDYNKGVMSKYMDLLIPEVPISIVDPKCGDIDRWRGCTVFKPNAQEALALSGCDSVYDAGVYLLDKLKCESVIITQSDQGVTVFDSEGIYEIKPTQKLPIAESVIGAGDCFIAFLAMAMARGMGIRKAAEVAWKAGTLYVKKRHNTPISRVDLINSFDPAMNKIIVGCPETYIGPKVRNYKLVFINGCFDLFHTGHLETLRFAKSQGDKLVVAVNSDESIARLKPGRPIIQLDYRMKLLASLECVDFVVWFDDDTPLELIKKIQPDVLVKSEPYCIDNIVGADIVKEVHICPNFEGLSTSGIIEKIKNGK